jgi:cell wall-associated NlpC family hydrolase
MKNLGLILAPAIAFMSIAHDGLAKAKKKDRKLMRLEKLYMEELYEKTIERSAKLREKEKYFKHPEPHLYKAMSQVKLSHKEEKERLKSMRIRQAGKAFIWFKRHKPSDELMQKHAEGIAMIKQAFEEETAYLLEEEKETNALFFMEILAEHYRDTIQEYHTHLESERRREEMSAGSSAFRSALVREDVDILADELVGIPYQFDGRDPSGFDSPGLVKYVFDQYGVELPDDPGEMPAHGDYVDLDSVEKGDVILFGYTSDMEEIVTHVGVCLSEPNEPLRVLHATNGGVVIDDVVEGTYWHNKLLYAVDVLQ